MHPAVNLQLRRFRERFLTNFAAERTFTGVDAHVSFEVTGGNKCLATNCAAEGSLARVNAGVTFQIARLRELLIAHVTGKPTFYSLNPSIGNSGAIGMCIIPITVLSCITFISSVNS